MKNPQKKKKEIPPVEKQFIELKLLQHRIDHDIFLCQHIITNEKVIIEKYNYEAPTPIELNSFLSRQSLNRRILSGIATLQQTYNVIRKPNFTWFVSEIVEGSSPLEMISGNPLEVSQAKYLFFLLTQTVLILHNHLLSFNDWRPENFIMCETMIKFINYPAILSLTPASNEKKLSYLGDPRWMSPESLVEKTYDMIQSDIWCLGLYLHFMLTGKMLFDKSRTLYTGLKKFQYQAPKNIDPAAAEILKQTLVIDPTKRMTLRDILSHRFLMPFVPFPINRVPLEQTPEISEWMEFFRYDFEKISEKIRSFVCDDTTMIFCLCLKCIEKGRKPSDYRESMKTKELEFDPRKNIIVPQNLDSFFNKESKTVKFNLPPKPKDLKSKQKTAKLHKLLNVCSSELSKRDPSVNHLDAFVEDTNY